MTPSGSGRLDGRQWRVLDGICCRFEEAWQRGERPSIEDYLKETAEDLHSRLFSELLALELEYRRAGGQFLTRREYHERWPAFAPSIDVEFDEIESVRDEESRRMKCPNCSHDNPQGSEACRKCKKPLQQAAPAALSKVTCSLCKNQLPASAMFCGFCGNPLQPQAAQPVPSVPQAAPNKPAPKIDVTLVDVPRPTAEQAPASPTLPAPAQPSRPVSAPVCLPGQPLVFSPDGPARDERREAKAERIAPGNSLRPMVLIPAGEFLMGSPEGSDSNEDERPQHKVRLSAYYIDQWAVTNTEYERFDPTHKRLRPEVADGDDDPVVMVNYQDCLNYCRWRAEQEKAPLDSYTLPTEAQWERAARGGFPDRLYPWGDAVAPDWCNTEEAGRGRTIGVASGVANGFMLFHMGSNVSEWCHDCYSRNYYAQKQPFWNDPKGPPPNPMENFRVVRGASFIKSAAAYGRCAARGFAAPRTKQTDLGFRCVRLVALR